MVAFLETLDLDKKLTEEEARSRAAEILVENQFLNNTLGPGRAGPSGDDILRVRNIQLRQAAAVEAARQRTCLGDDTLAAPNDNVKCPVGTRDFTRLAGTAISQGSAARAAVTSSEPPKIIPLPQFSDRVPEIPKNILNNHINLQYHLSLSMVPAGDAVGIQAIIPLASSAQTSQTTRGIDEFRGELEAQGAIPLASTGDVFQEDAGGGGISRITQDLLNAGEVPDSIDNEDAEVALRRTVTGRNYYNIKSLTIDNVMSPTKTNAFIADMVTSQMTMIEPHGFKLHEDIRAMADKIGYQTISPGRIVYRLDIFFSGYNQDTGEWLPFIPINVRNGTDKVKVITYYVNIVSMEADVEHTGTTYTLSLAPTGHIAWRPEEMMLEAGATITGGSGSNNIKRQTFGGFLDSLATTMNTACKQRTHNQIDREYEFIAPDQLKAACFFEGKFASLHGFIKQNDQGETVVTQGRDVDVLTVIEAALKDMTYTWDRFLKEEDQNHLIPRIHWGIRFNVVYEGGAHPGLYDFRKIKLQYIIEPFATFKKGTIRNMDDVARQVDTESQLQRVREMVRLGMVNRIYDYIHTSENTEVINFGVSLKQFYFRALNTFSSNQANIGEAQRESASNQVNKQGTKARIGEEVKAGGQEPPPPSPLRITTDEAIRAIFGGESRPKAACIFGNQPVPADILGGGLGEMGKTDNSSSNAGSDDPRRSQYDQELDDHIKNDLIVLDDFEVRGDPLWLLSPYANHSGTVLSSQDENSLGITREGIVQTRSSKVIFLRMFSPLQDDLMNPDRLPAGSSCSIIGGFYEIVSVKSTFDSGKFTQKLSGAKIENLNYSERFIDVGAEAEPQNEEVSTDDTDVYPAEGEVNEEVVGGFRGGLA